MQMLDQVLRAVDQFLQEPIKVWHLFLAAVVVMWWAKRRVDEIMWWLRDISFPRLGPANPPQPIQGRVEEKKKD